MRLEHHLVGGYVRYISPYIIIIYYYYYASHVYFKKYVILKHLFSLLQVLKMLDVPLQFF